MPKEKRNIVKLYQIPYGQRFRINGTEYIHERGDGMFPKVRNVESGEMAKAYIGTLVEKVHD